MIVYEYRNTKDVYINKAQNLAITLEQDKTESPLKNRRLFKRFYPLDANQYGQDEIYATWVEILNKELELKKGGQAYYDRYGSRNNFYEIIKRRARKCNKMVFFCRADYDMGLLKPVSTCDINDGIGVVIFYDLTTYWTKERIEKHFKISLSILNKWLSGKVQRATKYKRNQENEWQKVKTVSSLYNGIGGACYRLNLNKNDFQKGKYVPAFSIA